MVAAGKKEGVRLFVYALCEPDGKTIRYIGLSGNLWNRLHNHYSRACFPKIREWINGLRARGLVPALIVLREVVGIEAGLAAEAEEIAKHEQLSGGLLNEKHTGKPQPKKRRGLIEFGGKRLTLAQWATELGISRQALNLRLQDHPITVALSRGKDQARPLGPTTPPPKHDPGTETVVMPLWNIRTGLSHPERRERRKQMAIDLLRGMRRDEVSRKYGVTAPTVEAARNEFLGTSAARSRLRNSIPQEASPCNA